MPARWFWRASHWNCGPETMHDVDAPTSAGVVRVSVPAGSPIRGVELHDFLIGEFETSIDASFVSGPIMIRCTSRLWGQTRTLLVAPEWSTIAADSELSDPHQTFNMSSSLNHCLGRSLPVRASLKVRNAIQPMTRVAPMKSGMARKLIGPACPRSTMRRAASGSAEMPKV